MSDILYIFIIIKLACHLILLPFFLFSGLYMYHPTRTVKIWAVGVSIIFVCGLVSLTYISQQSSIDILSDHYSPQYDSDEKYISFLPHSGLHNQLSSLSNALVLASLINRTLIMPELNLGSGTYWRFSPLLADRLEICLPRLLAHAPESVECWDYKKYIPVQVEDVIDLSEIHNLGIKTYQRESLGRDYFQKYWGVPNDERNKSLAVEYTDRVRYSYQFHDTIGLGKRDDAPSSYDSYINIADLVLREEKFLIFNSMFGANRLLLTKSENIVFRRAIRNKLVFSHPDVLKNADVLVQRLGGPDNFASAHVRQGDGAFKKSINDTMDAVRVSLEGSIKPSQDKEDKADISRISKIKNKGTDRLDECKKIQDGNSVHPRLRLIYMATDAKKPRDRFKELYDEFVCMFCLGDFPDVIENVSNSTLETMGPGVYEGKGKLLLPLVDASVASFGSIFFGTHGSTFSSYIRAQNRLFHKLKASG
ncbi:hypothetical protein CLU79DRAFT_744779 [Phycomyces nitens]|nr:hypothetical protein CLU79DRAFT_744779 [Phycomyces nitens]